METLTLNQNEKINKEMNSISEITQAWAYIYVHISALESVAENTKSLKSPSIDNSV